MIYAILFLEVDEIYNLACLHHQFIIRKSIKTTKTSSWYDKHFRASKAVNAKVLQAGEVYGDPTQHPQKESYWGNVNPIGIRSCYDEGKRLSETLCFDYIRQNKVDVKVIRIFNTYGPNMSINDGRVVSNFIVQALKGDDITIYGKGDQTRSFQYIDDLILGMTKMMSSKFTGPVNIGNPYEFTILQLANLIIKLTKSKSKISFLELPSDDPKQRKPDIEMAKEKLNWEPKTSLEEGLKKQLIILIVFSKKFND